MTDTRKILIGFLLGFLSICCCGKNSGKSGDKGGPAAFFPEKIEKINLVRSSEIRIFEGKSLYEYINGGAEIYHLYDFIDVATASYKTGDKEIVLDIYRFQNADNAYGLYSSIKPLGPGNVRLGVEGFSTENSIDFVNGSYIVRVVGFEQSDLIRKALYGLANYLDELLPGTSDMPQTFSLFPEENSIPGSEKIMAESFLGQIFLDDVYTMDYEIKDSKLTLFITEDSSGEKYIKWQEAEKSKKDEDELGKFPFDSGKSFSIQNDYYRKIVAGLKGGKLVGAVGYNESHREFLSRWLESLNNTM